LSGSFQVEHPKQVNVRMPTLFFVNMHLKFALHTRGFPSIDKASASTSREPGNEQNELHGDQWHRRPAPEIPESGNALALLRTDQIGLWQSYILRGCHGTLLLRPGHVLSASWPLWHFTTGMHKETRMKLHSFSFPMPRAAKNTRTSSSCTQVWLFTLTLVAAPLI
jgi:hypothetical protein